MFDYDKWQEIFQSIWKHKLRTLLTALGVWWGIFMLVFLMGAGQGLENGVMGMFGTHAKNALYVWTQRTSMAYEGLPPGRRAQLTTDDITAIEQQCEDVIEYIAPRLFVPAGEINYGDNKGAFDVRGERPDLIHIEAILMQEGRFINELDMKYRRKTAVIGKRVQEVLFEEESAIGKRLTINGAEYTVVGVFASSRRGGGNADEDEELIVIPLSTAQQVRNRPRDINWFVCTIKPGISVGAVEETIKGVIRERHKIHPDDRQGVRSDNIEEEYKEITGLFFGIKFLVWLVGIGSLLAGIMGVGNIMLIVVKERTKEIGLRKAMGATPGSIISMIMLESVFITTIAGYIGLLTSTGVIFLIQMAIGEGSEFFANPQVNLEVGLAALFILVIAGALTGLIPALTAARIEPVVALRNE
ncbi:MAG: ABC transporter permease [Bacteroidota bacterium]